MDAGILSERTVRRIIAMGPNLEYGEITGIETPDGRRARVLTIGVPLLPDQIQNPANRELLDGLLKSAAVLAQRRGASVLTLGALLSSYAGGGTQLQKWREERKLTITIDNGAANTIATTLEVIRRECPISVSDAVIATVGAKGLIGYGVVKALEGKAKQVIALARERQGKDEEPEALDITPIARADVVVFATSSPRPIITKGNAHLLADAKLVVDVAVPPDVDDTAGVKVARSGLMLLPGDVRNAIDFHFGTHSTEHGSVFLLPACLAQGFVLAATEKFEHASLGARIKSESVAFFAEQCEKLGIKIVTSPLSEPAIYSALQKGAE